MEPTTALEKLKAHTIVKIIEYLPNAIFSKTSIRKITKNITAPSFDAGEELAEKISSFDNYRQIIDGKAEFTVNAKKFRLVKREGIIIPAHASHRVNANERFKIISTVIKSGYED